MFNILKKSIIFFILFLLFILCIFFYWKYPSVIYKKNLESLKYAEIIKKINQKNTKNFNEVENFIIQNNNIYGTLAALSLAKKYVLYNNLDKAFIQLKNSLKYTQEENLKNFLKLNMAKIQIQKNKNNEALNILLTIKNYNWNNMIENMKGDIFINKNNKKEALKHWEKSFLIEDSNASKEIINMKINELKK
ncbi:tetratricopeptide repeat protein [Buchnera aphidicola (Acyrthosiphon lactucae)]|uniref:Ancillary SecYEG translocon subunit n=1 Tax=Buchnera aphidicola (Acyrthosiphon lactucae) TaxID=1241832 RepID=A0A4D6XMH7_9GAMM|nr:tetratricopeptide repeat protein [Buchnera aphidicola]QCI17973.1 tetratricopeptide repeat protein [Buchnera aphidicola (Acyrthosiphon lactucae)]